MVLRRWLVCVGCASLALNGCDDRREPIRAYRAPKDPPPPAEAPAPAVAPAAHASRALAWDLPEGWKREPNPSAMRFATLSAGTDENRIEVSISHLTGDAGGVRANIQRWRGQVGLETAPEDQVFDHVEKFEAREARGLLVDLVGPASNDPATVPQRMLVAMFPVVGRTWFIKTTGPVPTLALHRDGFVALCRSVRFVEAAVAAPSEAGEASTGTSQRTPASEQPVWDLPDGWVHEEQPPPMSVASLRMSDGEQEAVLTITPLPGPTQLLNNIVRWRLQVGLARITSLDEHAPTPIEVAGQQGYYIDLTGASEGILGVIAPRGGKTWFYKLKGPVALLSKQKEAFEAFVRSVRFDTVGRRHP